MTHAAQFLPQADGVIFLRDGEMSASADFPKLLGTQDFSEFHEKLESGQISPNVKTTADDPVSFATNGGLNYTDDQQEAELDIKTRLNGKHKAQLEDGLELQERKPLINKTEGKSINAK